VAALQTGAPIGGRQVQSSMRRFTRMAIVGAIAAFVAVPLFATSAAAVDAGAAVCTFNVLPNPLAGPFPAAAHIEGAAPAGSSVSAFDVTNPGTPILLTTTLTTAGGTFHSADFGLTPPVDISATFTLAGNNYATGCANPEGLLVTRVDPAVVAAQQQRALAFTGSNNTTSFVLIGVTALIVGIVLTVGARRRSRVSS
jgi:LPXTG-motif cell wall-anchored protein